MMSAPSPESPEARRHRRRGHRARLQAKIDRSPALTRSLTVLRRVAVGVYSDGFIHAGNLAYLTLVAVFPFFILAAAIAQLLGQTQTGIETLNGFLITVPRGVADVLRPAIVDVLTARTGNLLWIGALVGLWSVGSLIETIRDILRRAYGTTSSSPFWHYRLRAIGIIVLSVVGAMVALSLQVLLIAAETVLERIFPLTDHAFNIITATRLVPTIILFMALHFLGVALAPSRYRSRRFPKWPGAAFTALWWYGTTLLLPLFFANLSSYSLTYGGLAGAMITLIFFFIIGLGVVIGAELNAALTDFPDGSDAAEETEDPT